MDDFRNITITRKFKVTNKNEEGFNLKVLDEVNETIKEYLIRYNAALDKVIIKNIPTNILQAIKVEIENELIERKTMSNFKCDKCGMINIDCDKDGYKTPREIELEEKIKNYENKIKNLEIALLKEIEMKDKTITKLILDLQEIQKNINTNKQVNSKLETDNQTSLLSPGQPGS